VAVKVILKISLHHDETVAILDEVHLMVQVDHPSIVKILAAYEDEKNFYLVMELVEGGELNTLLENQAYVEESQVQDIMRPLFDAVVYCHKL